MRRIAIIAFTRNGCALALRLARALEGEDSPSCAVSVSGPARFAEELGIDAYESLDAWTRMAFGAADAVLFVSATGIAVRAIAPYVRDKLSDPAVVSIDEAGRFAVPLLSGHVGGANDFARHVAHLAGAQAVISTATDVNGLFAVDEWAVEHDLVITDRALAKQVSAALLAGQTVGFASDFPFEGPLPEGFTAYDAPESGQEGAPCALGVCVSLDEEKRPFEQTLVLVPRIVVLGVGCRKDIDAQAFRSSVETALAQARISEKALCRVASIDVKSHEEAITRFCAERTLPASFFSAGELMEVSGEFSASEFVRATVGVDNVCERAALAACEDGMLVMRKTALAGTTAAAALPVGFALLFPDGAKKE